MASSGDNSWPPDDLPDLPEEWGVIVIPDDLAELDDEVRAIRRELEQERNPSWWRRFNRRPAMRRVRRIASVALRAPVLIISMAVLVTIASLFASAWPEPSRLPTTQRTSGTDDSNTITSLPALELFDENGQTVPLNAKLPAVILLTDGCSCNKLVTDTIAAVNPRIAIIDITGKASTTPGPAASRQTPPTLSTPQTRGQATQAVPAQSKPVESQSAQSQAAQSQPAQARTVQTLHDPSGSIRDELKVGPADGTAAALLVNGSGQVIRVINRTDSVADLEPDLARL